MQKITVEISAKGYTGLNSENIEKALTHYFGSPTLGVSFSVKEAAQLERAGDGACTCGKSILGEIDADVPCPVEWHNPPRA